VPYAVTSTIAVCKVVLGQGIKNARLSRQPASTAVGSQSIGQRFKSKISVYQDTDCYQVTTAQSSARGTRGARYIQVQYPWESFGGMKRFTTSQRQSRKPTTIRIRSPGVS
jgi:hypothetical protein